MTQKAPKPKAKLKPKAKTKRSAARRLKATPKRGDLISMATPAAMAVGTRSGTGLRDVVGEIVGLEGPVTVEKIRMGLPTTSVGRLGDLMDLTQVELTTALSVSKQTFQRRLKSGVLNEAESDRVVRYAQLLALASDLFEDGKAGAQWLKTPAPALGNETPLDHATTEMGARNVERLIGRLEHGIPT